MYLFTLHHPDGRTAIVGSSCVENYGSITPETAEKVNQQMRDIEAAHRAKIAAAKKAAQEEEIKAALAEWSEIEWDIDRTAQNWRNNNKFTRWEPQDIYVRGAYGHRLEQREVFIVHPYVKIPPLKTPAGQLKRIKAKIENAMRILERVNKIASA